MTETTPEFDGKCAFAVAMAGRGKAPAGNPKYTLEQNGKTYYFLGAVPKFLFQKLNLAAKADAKGAA